MTGKDKWAIGLGKAVSKFSTLFGLGAGATWPGEVALSLNSDIFSSFAKQFKFGIILVAGTNGKTTTALMLKTILHYEEFKVVYNGSGANLLNGLVSSCISASDSRGQLTADWGVFEVDENSLPLILRYVTPKIIVFMNLFRDQLDRYGEVDVIAQKWSKAVDSLNSETILVMNADDPLIAYLGKKSPAKVVYFGLTDDAPQDTTMEHATDSIFCLNCGSRLIYDHYYFSHLGDWHCATCGEKRPECTKTPFESPLPGLYNKYNTMAAALTSIQLGIHSSHIKHALEGFAPAFGRQETFTVNGKKIKILLSKNPTGFNASLRTVLDMKPRAILFALNDRIPDGRDVSWIWDVDFETIPDDIPVIVTGDRTYDMALRMQYTKTHQDVGALIAEPNYRRALKTALRKLKSGETLVILPTYSAMLDYRKIISGRKIL